jgi:hypothetical protein
MFSLRRAFVIGFSTLTFCLGAVPALADAGGVPHGWPDTCGVGQGEAHDFVSDSTLPGAGEIATYPPVDFGCTGNA